MTTELATTAAPLALGEFLQRHPWPDADAALGSRIEGFWTFEVDAVPDRVWPLVADTSRFNRAMGMSTMEFAERDGQLRGRSVNVGVVSEWVELPWTWVAERTLTCVRRYERGFARVMRAVYELAPTADGRTRLAVYFGFVPRGLVGRILLHFGLKAIRAGFEKVVGEIEQHLAREAPHPFTPGPASLHEGGAERLTADAQRLREAGLDGVLVDKLCEYVRSGDEMDIRRIRVPALARKWGSPPDEVLLACLHATRIGLLQMSWDVVCPHCRGVRQEINTLGEVPKQGECTVCGIDFQTDSENAVEVVFHVHPSVREVPEVFYCSAEPARKDHIKLQQRLAPGERLLVETRLYPGRYRLRCGGGAGELVDVQPDGARQELSWAASGRLEAATSDAEHSSLAPHPTVELVNDSDEPKLFVVESAHWSDDALRPARLFSFQGFRDLFTEEYVGSDIQLSVGEQTILFTDVVGSTEMYVRRGDPGAFVDVKRHFADIYEEVRTHGGAIVKTIGDAAMAAFVDPVSALRASYRIQQRLHARREDLKIRVRASLNTGPCIAVKLNTNIDYFGSTVNAAAKLQACAGAGQIAFPDHVARQPAVQAMLDEFGASLHDTELDSPALGGRARVRVWNVSVEE
ncbi:MAG: DUF5939 domain-containing protein [Polyangiaceae bacterium]